MRAVILAVVLSGFMWRPALAQLPETSLEPQPQVEAPRTREPVPSPATQSEIRRALRKEFRDGFSAAKSAEDKSTLATRLVDAAETESDPTRRYVLYVDARDLAAEAADVALIQRASAAMHQAFDVNEVQWEIEALKKAATTVRGAAPATVVADRLIQLSSQAAARDQYDVALEAIGGASSAATKAKDKLLVADLNDQRKELQQLQKEYHAVQLAEKVLTDRPDDADACRTVGMFLCQVKQDWERGLPLVARGARSKLQELAARDISQSMPDGDAMMSIGKDWLEFAKGGTNRANSRFAARAVHWFEQARSDSPGTTGQRAERELREAILVRDGDSPLAILLDRLRTDLKNNRTQKSDLLKSTYLEDAKPREFSELPAEGAALIGFNITLGAWYQFTVVRSLQPVFATASRTFDGEVYGSTPGDKAIEIRPRPGYVMTGIRIKTGTNRIDEISVQYTRLKKGALDPRYSYWTFAYGGESGKKLHTLLSGDKPILGIFGSSDKEILTLGIVLPP